VRIVLAADGTVGDVHPMRALGAGWLAEGHEVTLCGPPDFETIARASGLDYRVVGTSVREFLDRVSYAIAGNPFATLKEMTAYLDEVLRSQIEVVPAAAEGADLVIGAGVQTGAAVAGELHGIPYRYIAYCPVMFPSSEYMPVAIPASGMPRWLNRLAWRVFHPPFVRLFQVKLNRLRRELGLPRMRDAYSYLMSERPILACDRDLAWPGDDCKFALQQIRGLHPIDNSPLPEKLQGFLDAGPAPVYIGFGSMTDPAPAETTRKVLDAVDRVGCRAVISEGWAGLGDGPLPDRVFVTGPVPHGALFPRCALIVHHGGAGTTMSAARAGVPQLLVPHLLDQFYWAGQVRMLGIGPPALRRNRLRADRLAERFEASLGNEWLLSRTRDLAASLAALGPTTPPLAGLL
jgi:UDP:flavonoid glycosyltransferase YjiC (YdhE family)